MEVVRIRGAKRLPAVSGMVDLSTLFFGLYLMNLCAHAAGLSSISDMRVGQ
jgi:hypothetical protein